MVTAVPEARPYGEIFKPRTPALAIRAQNRTPTLARQNKTRPKSVLETRRAREAAEIEPGPSPRQAVGERILVKAMVTSDMSAMPSTLRSLPCAA